MIRPLNMNAVVKMTNSLFSRRTDRDPSALRRAGSILEVRLGCQQSLSVQTAKPWRGL